MLENIFYKCEDMGVLEGEKKELSLRANAKQSS